MFYKLSLTHEDNGYVITCPDIPECITQCDNYNDIYAITIDALKTSFNFYSEKKEVIPVPDESNQCSMSIKLPISLSIKIQVYNEFIKSGMKKAELSEKTGIRQQEIQRVFNFEHITKINTLEKIAYGLGKKLYFTLEEYDANAKSSIIDNTCQSL